MKKTILLFAFAALVVGGVAGLTSEKKTADYAPPISGSVVQ